MYVYIYTNSNTVIDQLSILVWGRAKKQFFCVKSNWILDSRGTSFTAKPTGRVCFFFQFQFPRAKSVPNLPNVPTLNPSGANIL